MAKPVVVRSGWVIQDQAAGVPGGFYLGSDAWKGRTRSGPLVGNHEHNLIGKNVVLHAEGEAALGHIVTWMSSRPSIRIFCGIRAGMQIEKWVDGPGGLEEVSTIATAADRLPMEYYVYAFADEPSNYGANALMRSVATGFLGFGADAVTSLSGIEGFNWREAWSKGFEAVNHAVGSIKGHRAGKLTDLQAAAKAKKVFVVLSGSRTARSPIATYRDTQSLPAIAKALSSAIQQGR